MQTQLKDVIHLYMGAQCLIGDNKHPDIVMMLNETGLSVCTGTNNKGIPIWYKTASCKLLLRPLSSISREEVTELWLLLEYNTGARISSIIYLFKTLFEDKDFDDPEDAFSFSDTVKVLNRLRKHSFDCDNLIPTGQAIDKTLNP